MINKLKASSLIGITGLMLCSCSTLPDRTKSAAATPIQEPAPVEQKAIATKPQAEQPEQATVTPLGNPEQVNAFIKKMVTKHHFDEPTLNQLFNSVSMQSKIIDAMNRPAEAMPWHKYRKIFMTEARIDGGLKFWQANSETLRRVEQQTGVPAEVIVAIIGVETQYGSNKGSYRVIDALSTLAFHYPKRSPFFTGELEQFLLLCREENMDPLKPVGSYAGAMGLPQFMPSSYRSFAADFENDRRRDIWNNPADAIASVANYFAKHKWKEGQAIAYQATANGQKHRTLLNSALKTDTTVGKLKAYQVQPLASLPASLPVKLMAFEQTHGDDLWLGLENFFVITRYNHSPLYAMAVFQLSQALTNRQEVTRTKPQ